MSKSSTTRISRVKLKSFTIFSQSLFNVNECKKCQLYAYGQIIIDLYKLIIRPYKCFQNNRHELIDPFLNMRRLIYASFCFVFICLSSRGTLISHVSQEINTNDHTNECMRIKMRVREGFNKSE